MSLPNKEDFQKSLNTSFCVVVNEEIVEALTLLECTSNSNGPMSNSELIGFSLIFEGNEKIVLPQMMYFFRHDFLQEFPLFIVPIGFHTQSGCMRYQAVFN